MNTGPLQIYDAALFSLMLGTFRLAAGDKTAVLLDTRYVPDLTSHATFGDVQAYELSGGQYQRQQMTGARLEALPGAVRFISDPLNWGNPVTLPPAKYLAVVAGLKGGLKSTSLLLAVIDLAGSAVGAVEASHGPFVVSPPPEGWFEIRADIAETASL